MANFYSKVIIFLGFGVILYHYHQNYHRNYHFTTVVIIGTSFGKCANRQCQNSCSQLHMRMTKHTHIPRSANAIFLLVGVWLLLLQEDPTNISILILLFCFSQCHPHCCMTLPALLRFLLHPPLEDYFPSLPLGGGWGRSQESSLLSAHFNNSLDLNTKIPHVRCGPLLLPREDHQFGGGLLGGVASHLPQVGLHPE